MGFPRQEYWSGLLFPPPGDLPNLGIKPPSPALQLYFLPLGTTRDVPLCSYKVTNVHKVFTLFILVGSQFYVQWFFGRSLF